MRKLYSPLFLILFTACGTQVRYLGSNYSVTESVDVFVTQSSVKKPFEIIGKGYIQHRVGPEPSVEIIQRKAVEKAKANGANAVVIEDYFLVDNTSSISTRADSLKRIKVAETNPAISSGFTILFLRYKE